MKTSEQVKEEFMTELNDLFLKWGAEIELQEEQTSGTGWERGLDEIIIYICHREDLETGEVIHPYTKIALGRQFYPTIEIQ